MGAVFVMILLRCVIAHLNWVVEKCGENQGDATTREGKITVNSERERRALTVASGWKKYGRFTHITAKSLLIFH